VDVFRFTGAGSGDAYTVDGSSGTDIIDLSEFSTATITNSGGVITVDRGGGNVFTINHSNVETIITAASVGNHGPLADAGVDQTVATSSTVTLTGAGSSDQDGNTLTYQWTQIEGPKVTLSSSTAASPTFTAPGSATTLQFIVVVSDGTTSHADTVVINVGTANSAPTITSLSSDSLSYSEGDGAVVIEQGANALVADADSTNFDTGTLAISIPAGGDSAEDVLSIRSQGTGAGQISVAGGAVAYGGVTIGTYSGGANGTPLVITLNSNATPTAVTALVKNIPYENTDTTTPTTGARTVRYVLTDGDGGTSANYDTTVTVSEVNDVPTADAAGPYAISEGQNLTLNAGSSSDPEGNALTYAWDLDNDGNYGEVDEPTTVNPTVTWATLQSFGIADNGSYTIGLRVSDGTTPVTTTATVNVSNTAPTLNVTGSATANSGGVYTLNLSDIDPGNDTISSWIVNWGDGSIGTYVGDPSSVTHTYSNDLTGFTFSITASAIDEDGQYYEADMWLPAYVGSELDVVDGYVGNVVDFFAMSDGLIGHANVVQKPDGNFLISGHGSSNVLEYQPDGTFVGTFVTAGSGGLNGAAGMDFGADGKLYITSSNSGKVLRFDGTTGAFIGEFVSSGLNFPLGLTFGPDGDLYVASQGSDGVLKFDGVTGILDATFNAPPTSSTEDITFGPDGNLYVSSLSNGVFRLNGTTGALIDNFVAINAGGLSSAAGVEFGPDGNLYVSDQNANVVRRYDGTTGAYIDDYIAPGSVPGPAYMVFTADHQVTVVASVAPTITNLAGDSLAYTEGDGAVVIEQGTNALVADTDSTNFATGTLTVSFTAGSDSAEDVLSIRNQGTGAGQIGVSGSNVTYGGVTIGTFTGGSSGSNLVVTLNASATPTAVTALVKNITYENTDTNAPTTGARTVRYVLTDGDGGTSANYDTTVTVSGVNDAPTDLSSGIELNTDGGNDAYLISDTGLSQSLTATTVEIRFAANDLPFETVLMSFNNLAGDELSIQA
jgi:WD40 repeat protein